MSADVDPLGINAISFDSVGGLDHRTNDNFLTLISFRHTELEGNGDASPSLPGIVCCEEDSTTPGSNFPW